MSKTAFIGFGEVNTPIDIIINKCKAAEEALKGEGLDLISVYPVTDDYEEKDIKKAKKEGKEPKYGLWEKFCKSKGIELKCMDIHKDKKLISGCLELWLGNGEGMGIVSGYGVSLRGHKKCFNLLI